MDMDDGPARDKAEHAYTNKFTASQLDLLMTRLKAITSDLIPDTLTNDLVRESITESPMTFVRRFRQLNKGSNRSKRELNELVFLQTNHTMVGCHESRRTVH